MTFPFNPTRGAIVVEVEVSGPTGQSVVRMALDTGCLGTVVDAKILASIGHDPSLAPGRVSATTASGVVSLPRLPVNALSALGHVRTNFPVLAHILPATASSDGLLGLDFFRGHVPTIDFQKGEIELVPGGPTP